MGAVYLAYDNVLERAVALKIPHFDLGSNPEIISRFLREARAAAGFHHPNFCPIHDVGEIEGTQYLAMAYVEGQTLSAWMGRDRPVPPRQAAMIARQLAMALGEAHNRGIVHRDLKPANVMVDPRGTLIIMDFGIARRMGAEDAEWTRSGALMGTPHYMSPEQVRGDKHIIGPATDIYALGVILYQLLSGQRPFEGSISLVLGMIAIQEPARLSSFNPALDPALEAICQKAMAKRIEDRFPSMRALFDALGTYLDQSDEPQKPAVAPPSAPAPVPAPAPAPTPAVIGRKRSPLLVPMVTAFAILAVIGAATFGLLQSGLIRIGGKDDVKVADARPVQTDKPANDPLVSPPIPRPAAPEVKPADPAVAVVAPPPPPDPKPVAPPVPAPVPAPAPAPEMKPVVQIPPVVPTPPPADNPTLALAELAQGEVLLSKGQPDRAISRYDAAIDLDPRLADAHHKKAIIYMGRKDYDRVIAAEEKTLAIDPNHADAHDNLGSAWFARKEYDKAIAAFRKAVNIDKDHPKAYINLGLAHYAKGDLDRAIADFTEALDNLEDNPRPDLARKVEALVERGRALSDLDRHVDALKDFAAAIAIDRNCVAAFELSGRSRYDLRDYVGAILDFDRAVVLDEDHPTAFIDRGLAYQATKQHAQAIQDFTEALGNLDTNPKANNSRRAEAHLSRGYSYYSTNQVDRAIQDYDVALQLNPRYANAYDYRGLARRRKKDLDGAIDDFTNATHFDSKHPNAWENRAMAFEARRNFGQAIRDFEQAIKIEPKDGFACSRLASLLATCPEDALRNGPRAFEMATNACEEYAWKDAYALDALAAAHAELGEFAQAVDRQNQAIALIPDEPTRENYRGRLRYYQQGMPFRIP